MNRSSAGFGVDPSGDPRGGIPNDPVRSTVPPGAQVPRHDRFDDADSAESPGEAPPIEASPPSLERLIEEAVVLAGSPAGANGTELAALVRRFWRLVAEDDLVGRTAAQMLAATRAHRELALGRLIGEVRLTVEVEADHIVIMVVTDDMPFLVDSVTAAINAAGLEATLLAHPLVVVRRGALGALEAVCPQLDPDAATAPGLRVDSWIRVEVRGRHDENVLTRLRNDIHRVLTDVREAVEDWPRMRERALALAKELADERVAATLPVPEKDITDSVALLHWLADDHFTFLGYREYRLREGPGGENLLEAVQGTGLGILRQDPASSRRLKSMSPEAYARVLEKRLLIITKANSRATVHRPSYLDYISFKIFDDGAVVGERRFLGLFSSSANYTSVRELPVVRRKVAEVMARSGLTATGHSGKDLLAILEGYPRDELFQTSTDDLYRTVMGVLRLAGRRQVRLFARKDKYGRFISCLVYLPRDRYTTHNRTRIQQILQEELNGLGVDFTVRLNDGPLARLHFTVHTDPSTRLVDIDHTALTSRIARATRHWEDDFQLTLERNLGAEQARLLSERYRNALPDTYKDSHNAHEAAQDIAMLELIDDQPEHLVLHLFRRRKNDSDVRFKVFRHAEPMMLSDVLPVLHSLGARVSDERPYEITRPGGTVHLYDFGLRLPAEEISVPGIRAKVENAFAAAWRDESEVDRFNELVIRAGLTWRQVVVLRAYAKYLRQTGAFYSQDYMESTLTAHPQIAANLVALFEARFHPSLYASPADREPPCKELVEVISHQLDAVSSLDQDRILRSFLTLITATCRTSFFQRGEDGRPKSYVAFKLDPQAVPELPAPRPRHEIFVYSPRFEGVHLRFGAVARGGIRWSDRREDFRTEVLGLVKAQMVKNAVIVPVGAKGGFVLKQAPADRAGLAAEGVACYRQFISALLDVTDNLGGGGVVVTPPDVVRHDGDDPYLVVAADKGTATFSDIANEVSLSRGFWLGDAFASGGSAGYDHKKMGITARGAWESVKRHFREMGIDTQTQDFTAVGIGDMSGDVFGNAMLRSPHIRLVAAFDHRDVFVDPTPDAQRSFVERKRLFNLPGSSWQDYDPTLISPGGGVFSRTAKTIPISEAMRAALGIEGPVSALAPTELIRAILAAPVDLLFNGGVGTYVKATDESHAEVGDKTNDGVRINGALLRATVVGEGGNLGLTQRGRVEYCRMGGAVVGGVRQARICTDFIDNSAGVDTSDHEVNIKILLGGAVADGVLTCADRDALLAEMTQDVAELVLRDNYDQVGALSLARAQAHSLLPVHRRMITEMERKGRLDRSIEALPSDAELEARGSLGQGLTPPELAVLLAYTKIILEREITESALPDDDWTYDVLRSYFPTQLRLRFADRMRDHRLRREIVSTAIVNEVVNRGGITFVFRAMEETGASGVDVLRAYVVTRDVFGLPALWAAVEALDNQVPAGAQTMVYLEIRRLIDRAVRWLVTNRPLPLDVTATKQRLQAGVGELLPHVTELFRGREREALAAHSAHVEAHGVPHDIADWATRVMYGFGLIDIVEVARETGRGLTEVAGIYYVMSERFHVDDLLSRISNLPREDRWQTLARMALRYDLYAALAALTKEVLAASTPAAPPVERVGQWEDTNRSSIDRTRAAIGELDDTRGDLATMSVLLRQIRTLVRPSST